MTYAPRVPPLIRSFDAGDLDAIARVHWEAARVAYAYRQWRFDLDAVRNWYAKKLDEWDWRRLAVQSDRFGAERPVGFAAAMGPFLDQLFVVPSRQRTGIGRRLLNAMLARGLRPTKLHVLRGNAPARTFYEKHGFRPERDWWDEDEQETIVLYRLD